MNKYYKCFNLNYIIYERKEFNNIYCGRNKLLSHFCIWNNASFSADSDQAFTDIIDLLDAVTARYRDSKSTLTWFNNGPGEGLDVYIKSIVKFSLYVSTQSGITKPNWCNWAFFDSHHCETSGN